MTETTRTLTPKEAARLLRRDLRRAWPGVRFSVRCDRGTAASWINVRWTDGPTSAQVDRIASNYEGRHFDGTIDGYRDMPDRLLVGTSGVVRVVSYVDGINCHREVSDAALATIQAWPAAMDQRRAYPRYSNPTNAEVARYAATIIDFTTDPPTLT